MRKLRNAMVDRRTLLSRGLVGAAALGLAACDANGADDVNVTVTVWGPQEDQSPTYGSWLQTQCEAFAAAHPEWTLAFKYGVCPEGELEKNLSTDPSAGADVYLFANDQIPSLVKCVGIAELGGIWVDEIRQRNSQTTVNTVTYQGGVYGVPYTANTWFMYYDTSVFAPEDVTSLDAMLQKGKVAFPLDVSWYFASFYVANGCTLFGEDGDDAEAGIDFGGEKAIAVTNYLVDLVANPNFTNGDVSTAAGASAFFSGTWDYEKAIDAFGDNLGIAPAPTITIGGEAKQMKAFAGSKAAGANPSTALYREHPEVAVALAAYLGGDEAQRAHYELRTVIPTDENIVLTDKLAMAQMDTMSYASIVQPLQDGMSNYWTPAESMGKELVGRKVTHENAAQKTEAMNVAMNSSVVQ